MNSAQGGRVVVCQVGEVRFALSVDDVREVCTGVTAVQVPGVAAPVEGVANVRGTLVTVVRGAELLGVAARSEGPSPWLVVLHARGGRVGLGVDDVLDLGSGDEAVTRVDLEGALESVFGRLG